MRARSNIIESYPGRGLFQERGEETIDWKGGEGQRETVRAGVLFRNTRDRSTPTLDLPVDCYDPVSRGNKNVRVLFRNCEMYSFYDESSIKKNRIAVNELIEFVLFLYDYRMYYLVIYSFVFSYHLSNYAKNSG